MEQFLLNQHEELDFARGSGRAMVLFKLDTESQFNVLPQHDGRKLKLRTKESPTNINS